MTVGEIRGKSENDDKFPAGLRVLAVDDDPVCLKLLDTLLRKCQYHVTTTSQAWMALKMLRENKDRFDLVISDVYMPDMDGFKLLELVGLEMDLPVIMLSENGDQKLVMKGVTHGACDYLVKPVRIEELRNIWQHVIRRKKIDSNNQNTSTDQIEDHQANLEGQGSPSRGNADQNGKLNRKRKDEDGENEDNDQESEDPAAQKKPRVVWSIELHRKFVAAVNQLGIEKAVPKRILDMMDVEGLTRENVASHLQKYRLYLKRISSVATQQANMVAAFGVKDSPFMRMASLDGLGDFRTLAGQGRLANVALTPYSNSGLLGRLNSPANVNLHNIRPCALIQPSHSPHLSNSITGLGKMHPVLSPASQNASLFQGGIPSSLGQDQLQQNKCTTGILNFNDVDDSRMFTAGPTFTDTGEVISNSRNPLNRVPNNPILLHGNGQQALSGGGFGNQSSLSMTSFNSESFNAVTNENWPNAVELSSIRPNSMLRTEPFHGQFPLNNSSNAPYLQNRPINLSSTTMASVSLEDSRHEMQCQESLVGNVQNMNQAHNQRRGEQKQNYIHSSNNTFGSLNSRDPAGNDVVSPLSHNLDQNSGPFNQKMGLFLNGRSSGGSASTLEQAKIQSGLVSQSYDMLDDLMTAVIKREQDGTMATPDFGFDDYSFGQGI